MCKSLPFISSILFSRSLNDKPIRGFLPFPYSSSVKLVNRFARHFLERGHSRRNFDQPTAAQCNHAALNSFLFQFHGRSAYQNQFTNLVVNFHYLVQTAPSFVPVVIADTATFALLDLDRLGLVWRESCINQRLRRHIDRLNAVFAHTRDQSLGADQMDRRCNQEWFDT